MGLVDNTVFVKFLYHLLYIYITGMIFWYFWRFAIFLKKIKYLPTSYLLCWWNKLTYYNFSGKAICKSLEADIVECMGVSKAERIAGLTRLMFVNCAPVQLDATHSICSLLGNKLFFLFSIYLFYVFLFSTMRTEYSVFQLPSSQSLHRQYCTFT